MTQSGLGNAWEMLERQIIPGGVKGPELLFIP